MMFMMMIFCFHGLFSHPLRRPLGVALLIRYWMHCLGFRGVQFVVHIGGFWKGKLKQCFFLVILFRI